MFCYQCEQTVKGTGCTVKGVCGKDGEVAGLQDLLIYATKGLSMFAWRAAQLGTRDRAIDLFMVEALFTTVTNVDFDPERVEDYIRRAGFFRDKARRLYETAAQNKGQRSESLVGPAAWTPAANRAGMLKQAEAIGVEARQKQYGEVVAGLQDLILFGLKGAAAYMDHAHVLGQDDPQVYAKFHEALNYLAGDQFTTDSLLAWALATGALNLRVMELLDAGNTGTYGHPEPTAVRITPIKGKAILISGHDLKDLEELLKQTAGKGINIYTHGEMLPANAYPKLKQYAHLAGNYGGAWQNQAKEFDAFPGAILMTTNCIQQPRETYKARIFTSGLVAWPGVVHIADRDFAPVIDAALAAPGFAADEPEQRITIGFGRQAVMNAAGTVVEAVKSGALRHFFLVGGCDGAKPGRNYYTEFAQKVPKDCVVLTLACGKYRFNKLDLGTIGGLPRVLDMGQCNDAYSAIQVAVALSQAFNCGVNDLPLSMILSWYEQKAVAILLTLLHLGIKNIRLGPSLPAFVKPAVLQVLVDKFGIKPITTPDEDLKAILG